MAIKIYREESKELITPMLSECREYFCDSFGERILWIKGDEGMLPIKNMLTKKGYRTDFAEWDEEGRLVRFLEEIV
jgi:hypothetical protein